jgi:hypothetical protein
MNLANGISRPQPTRMPPTKGLLDGSFGMQPQGDLSAAAMEDASRYLNGNGNKFVPDLDMMALLRAKEKLNMMQRGGSVSDRIRAFNREQFAKGQGIPMSIPTTNLDNLEVSSSMIDSMKRSAAEMKSTSQSTQESESEEPKGKRRKKAKKPSDMPRRALSAYNIFFSDQRRLILQDIEAKEKGRKAEANEEEEAEVKEEEDSKTEASEVPSVMKRTFFPSRTKRAHRKVHGKIGLVDLARQVSQRWKALSPEKRKHYQDLAEQDRQRHKKVMADYQERKAAENMISIGSPTHTSEEAPELQMQRVPTEQELRETMAHQYQQRILAEMMTARQQAQPNMGMSGFQQMMSQRLNAFQAPQPANFGQQNFSQQNFPQQNFGQQNFPQQNFSQQNFTQQNFAQQNFAQQDLLALQSLQNPLQNPRAQMWQQMGLGPM